MPARLVFAAALAAATTPAAAQVTEAQPAEREEDPAMTDLEAAARGIAQALRGEKPPAEVFAPSFLAAVPEAQLRALAEQMTGQLGPLEGLDGVEPTGPDGGKISLRFERGIIAGPMVIGPDVKVVGLLLNDIRPLGDSADAITLELDTLPGTVSVLYAPLDPRKDPIVSHNADAQLAIGSTFKLYVLSALAQQVQRGARSWDDVVKLDTRSLPSGLMQDWPRGAPVTLHTLAALMISISDNTATDQLIHLLGRAALNEEVVASGHSQPARMLPFLTTLELFGYKGDPARAGLYAAADEDRQGVLLEAFAQEISRNPDKITPLRFSDPTMIDSVEWFASASDIRRLMERIVELDDPTAREIMGISPAMPDSKRGEWVYIGYKGGSEPGVLNLSWLLQSPAGEWRVLAMSWNDPQAPLDTPTFELLAQRLLSLPRP